MVEQARDVLGSPLVGVHSAVDGELGEHGHAVPLHINMSDAVVGLECLSDRGAALAPEVIEAKVELRGREA